MQSMTGFGRGAYTSGEIEIVVEISGVNRKQLDIAATLPREFPQLEPIVRELISQRVTRGRVNVNANVVAKTTAAATAIDAILAKAYYAAMKKLQRELGAAGEVTIDTVLRAPGVLRPAESALTSRLAETGLRAALGAALDGFVAMRAKEGKHLAADVAKRIGLIDKAIRTIRKRQPAAVKRYREILQTRLRDAGVDVRDGDDRLMKEIAIFAERSDVSEELARIESHLEQAQSLLGKSEPVGRSLEFIVQELGREFNTLGSKSQDVEISRVVLTCKGELEKVREQVQNIE
jgi:uncharacterized protein (TIGR00255 family)